MREVDADASYTSFLVNVAMSSNVTPLQVSERENEGQTGSSFALAVDVMKQTDTHTKRKKENRHQTRDGRRTRSTPACTSRILEGRSGTQGTGAGSASRHGGGLGRIHPHDRVPGIPPLV